MAITTLTYGLLKKRLQIANCCAAKQGEAMIAKKNKGISCAVEQKKIQRIVDYVDCFGDFGLINGSDPNPLSWTPTGPGGSGTIELIDEETNLVIGVADWTISVANTFNLLVASTNNHIQNGTPYTSPWGENTNGYTASYNSSTGIFKVLAPSGVGSSYNGKEVFFAYQGGAWSGFGDAQTFSGGTPSNANDTFDDTNTCLKTNEIIGILDALCELCKAPCTTYVNF